MIISIKFVSTDADYWAVKFSAVSTDGDYRLLKPVNTCHNKTYGFF